MNEELMKGLSDRLLTSTDSEGNAFELSESEIVEMYEKSLQPTTTSKEVDTKVSTQNKDYAKEVDEVVKVFDTLIGYDKESLGIWGYELGNGRTAKDVIKDIDLVRDFIITQPHNAQVKEVLVFKPHKKYGEYTVMTKLPLKEGHTQTYELLGSIKGEKLYNILQSLSHTPSTPTEEKVYKHPLGIPPRYIKFEEGVEYPLETHIKRYEDICCAMERYRIANIDIPKFIQEEYNQYQKFFKFYEGSESV